MPDKLLHTAAVPFESARKLDAGNTIPQGHRSRRLHGHSFVAMVHAELPGDWASFPGAETDELCAALKAAVAPLDYHCLNDIVAMPSDENLARWIAARMDVPGVRLTGVQSTQEQGVDFANNDRLHLWRRYAFESAHHLPNVSSGHPCGRMHGHGFMVIVHVEQAMKSRRGAIDYDHLDNLWAGIHRELDQTCLNDIPGLGNPTSELIASWIWNRLKPELPELTRITVYETATCGAHFDGANYKIWKDLSLDSALKLARAPVGDRRRRIHGHTYTLRLQLSAPLNAVMGWTTDFGDVKEIFTPTFQRLDHQPLHEIKGLKDNDVASLLAWIRATVANDIPSLDRIELYYRRGCGAILDWGGRANRVADQSGPPLPV